MYAQQLNNKVVIKQMAAGQDAAGQPIQTWSELATVWADIRHQSGAESIRADRVTSIVKASIRVLKRSDVTAAMRVYHGATVYEIKAVLPDAQMNIRMDLACELIA
jgi:SPP1 family predicted phage head-tail adaptor